ncbi:MAG TPA: acetyl-CoA carboxylase biotin carboxyl carrier protein [Atopostipes sp.]|nr:acetyl-CoA carboxylase biotin carboxyl carrier protein [Atopostipes sp.]
MKYEELRELITHIDESSLAYVDVETESHHVIISKEVPQMRMSQEDSPQAQTITEPSVENEVRTVEIPKENVEIEVKGEVIEAPMVGVVYLQATPDADPYVKVGDKVEQGDVICIVEAMKLMNEIQAPFSGVITEVFVQNEEVVEYGQPLLRMER